jgi:hypothetical protein
MKGVGMIARVHAAHVPLQADTVNHAMKGTDCAVHVVMTMIVETAVQQTKDRAVLVPIVTAEIVHVVHAANLRSKVMTVHAVRVQMVIDRVPRVLPMIVEIVRAVHALKDYHARMIVHKAVTDRAVHAANLRSKVMIVPIVRVGMNRHPQKIVHAVHVQMVIDRVRRVLPMIVEIVGAVHVLKGHAQMIVRKAAIDRVVHVLMVIDHVYLVQTMIAEIVRVVHVAMRQHPQKTVRVAHVRRVGSSVLRAQEAIDHVAQALIRMMIAVTVRANHAQQVIIPVETRMTVRVSHVAIVLLAAGKANHAEPAVIVRQQVEKVDRNAVHVNPVHNK